MFKLFYNKVLNYPYLLIILFLTLLSYSVYQSKNFELDASADTLLIENDPDLIFLRELNKKYKSEEFFIITYSPINLSVKDGIKELNKLVIDINNFKWVSKTISIINAPLLQSTNEPLVDRIKNLKFITNEEVDLDTAINELTNSPVYKNLIISEDTKTFGIVVYLKDNNAYLEAIQKKTEILSAKNIDQRILDELNIKLKNYKKNNQKILVYITSPLKN
jgi:predicted RND superfamily exporter protein